MNEKSIAERIRAYRRQKKITLQELADLTGFTKGYLSKIERSHSAPPYSTLNKIATALGFDVIFLFRDTNQEVSAPQLSFNIENRREIPENSASSYGYTYQALATDRPGKNMEPYVIEPAFELQTMFEHEGEEFIYVLEGRHELVYDGKPYIMKKGDSAYYDSRIPHSGRSLGKKQAKLLVVLHYSKKL
ncbi:MAG: cupin domain-containing protein [Desulfobacteraceae bacterium]|jgi:transcriptional regulator with XRE-family HTH domain